MSRTVALIAVFGLPFLVILQQSGTLESFVATPDVKPPTSTTAKPSPALPAEQHNANLLISPTFIRDLTLAPLIRKDCRVEFKEAAMRLCYTHTGNEFYDSTHVEVVTRLLEYHFECNTSHLVEQMHQQQQGPCLWIHEPSGTSTIGPNDVVWNGKPTDNTTTAIVGNASVFMLPFLFHDFYALPTMRRNVSWTYCFVPHGQGRLPAPLVRLTLDRHYSVVLQKARLCDYIATASLEGFMVADSIGIPAVGIYLDNRTIGKHRLLKTLQEATDLHHYVRGRHGLHSFALDRHDTSTAQAIAETFPFDFFHKVNVSTSTAPSTEPPKNKTLVVVIGSLRGGELSWNSMYKHLLDVNSADLALMIGKRNATAQKTESLYDRAKYLWEFEEHSDWADAIDEIDNTKEWRTSLLPSVQPRSGIMGGVGNLIGSGAIIFMIRYWLSRRIQQLNLTAHYDRFVVTRSDQFYKCAHDLSTMDPRYVWVPTGEDYGGVTDRHWVLSKEHVLKALNILPNLIEYQDRLILQILAVNPENLIRLVWESESIYPHQVRRYPRMFYTGFVDGVDSSRWVNQKLKWGMSEDGLHIKYKKEYDAAKCFCGGGFVYDYEFNKSVGEYITNGCWQKWACKERAIKK